MKYTRNLKANTSILSNLCLDTLYNIFEFLDFVNLLNLSKVNKSLNENLETLIKDKINNFIKKYNIELLNFLQIEKQNFCNIREFSKKDYDIFAFLCIKNFTTIKTNNILIRTIERLKLNLIFPLQMILKTILSSTKIVTIDLADIKLSLIELNLISSFLNFKFGNCWNIELNYINSNILVDDFMEIIKNLKVNTTIKKLNLKNIKLCLHRQYNIFEALAEALVFNKCITELNLTNTEICKYDCTRFTKFLEALKKNTHLTKLDLSKNYINKDTIEKLIEVLKVNTTLTNISISYKESYNKEIISYQSTIKAALLRNKNLTKLKNKKTKKLSNILVIMKSSLLGTFH